MSDELFRDTNRPRARFVHGKLKKSDFFAQCLQFVFREENGRKTAPTQGKHLLIYDLVVCGEYCRKVKGCC